jgi:capsular polysaccharide biosynthesis protein
MRPDDGDSVGGTVRNVLRSWYIVLAAMLFATAGAVAYSTQQPRTYDASAAVGVGLSNYQAAIAGGGAAPDPARQIQTVADMLGTRVLQDNVKRRLEAAGIPASRLVSVETKSTDNSSIISVDTKATTARAAVAYANTTVTELMRLRDKLTSDGVRNVRDLLDQKVKGAPTKAARTEIAGQANNVDAFRVLQDDAVQVVSRASVGDTVKPADATIRNGAIGLVLGLFVGLGLALLRKPKPRYRY